MSKLLFPGQANKRIHAIAILFFISLSVTIGNVHAAQTINSVKLNGNVYSSANPLYVSPGQLITVEIQGTLTGASNWLSSAASFSNGSIPTKVPDWRKQPSQCFNITSPAGGYTSAGGPFTHIFTYTVQASPTGTLHAYFGMFDKTVCGGAANTVTWTNAIVVDNTPPTVVSILRADANPTSASSVSWSITFSEIVTGVDSGDFALTQAGGMSGAAITSVTGSGTSWVLTASTGNKTGTLGLNLVDNDTIKDRAGNPLGGTGTGNGNLTGEIYSFISISSFDAVETSAAGATPIYTKLAGTSFSLDILALNSDNSLATGYTGTVNVKLVDASGGAACASMPLLQDYGNLTFNTGTGRKAMSFTYASAARNARIRIYDSSANVTACSTDNFSIRPISLTLASATANADATGTSVSATPAIKAGTSFTLTATALTGYNGTPSIDSTKIAAHSGAVQIGTLTGSFSAANSLNGVAAGSGTGFTYSEVGYFNFATNGVYDDTFTAVDQPNDCTSNFSNSPVGNKYGCKFGNTSASVYFGRFTPDHFTVTTGTLTNRRLLSCSPVSSFAYAGEQLRVGFTLVARNGAGNLTKNYTTTSGFSRLDGGTISNFGFGAVDLADATPPTSAAALTASLGLVSSSGSWVDGSGAFTADLGLSRAAAPDGPYESFSLGIDPQDADGVKLDSYNLDTSVPSDTNDHALVGTTKIRYGRLRLSNANGSELLDLPVPMQVQYWNGSTFVTNTNDSCTTLSSSNIGMGNYKKQLGSGETSVSAATISFTAGVGNMKLTKPGAGNSGSVDLVVDLGTTTTPNMCPAWPPVTGPSSGANKSYLRGAWCGGAYDRDPTARATFGIYQNANEFIYMREMY